MSESSAWWRSVSGQDHAPTTNQRQADILNDQDDYNYRRTLNRDVAIPRTAGTHVWRSEAIPDKVGRDRSALLAHLAQSGVGQHWTASPDAVPVAPGQSPVGGGHSVVWHGIVEHPDEQTVPRDHPLFQGQHAPMDWESEFRLLNHAQFRVLGAATGGGSYVPLDHMTSVVNRGDLPSIDK